MSTKFSILVAVTTAEHLLGQLLQRSDPFWGAVIATAASYMAFPDVSPETIDANVLAATGVKVDRTRCGYAASVLKNMRIVEDDTIILHYRLTETKQELAYRLFHPDIHNPEVHQELVERLFKAAAEEDSWQIPL